MPMTGPCGPKPNGVLCSYYYHKGQSGEKSFRFSAGVARGPVVRGRNSPDFGEPELWRVRLRQKKSQHRPHVSRCRPDVAPSRPPVVYGFGGVLLSWALKSITTRCPG